jgi:hypothetical protein
LGDNMILKTGRRIWDSALVLAKFFDNSTFFPAGFWHGKKVIELGAGMNSYVKLYRSCVPRCFRYTK